MNAPESVESTTKMMLFVSTGRCGSTRIAQILREKLNSDFVVQHQMRFSRLANIVGNILYRIGHRDGIKRLMFRLVIHPHLTERFFISTDPLVSMVIPEEQVLSEDVCLVHIERDADEFSRSMFAYTRTKWRSFIAHNFVPFWQPGLWPLENLFRSQAGKRYREISLRKNAFFEQWYQRNRHYTAISMKELFASTRLEETVSRFFDVSIKITEEEKRLRSNVSAGRRQ